MAVVSRVGEGSLKRENKDVMEEKEMADVSEVREATVTNGR